AVGLFPTSKCTNVSCMPVQMLYLIFPTGLRVSATACSPRSDSAPPARRLLSLAIRQGSLAPRPALRVLSTPEPGRLRLAVDGLQRSPDRAREIERAVRAVDGVQRVQPSPRTGNVLIRFDAARCSAAQLVQAASRRLGLHAAGAAPPDGTTVVRSATPGRLRLAVAGLRQRPDRVPLVIEAL